MLSLIFLGTGGGRFATITQARATGGLYILSDSSRIHIDPGPGSLIKLKECGLDPTKTRAIIVTHCHPDHYNDAEVLVEAMTHGCKKRRGLLAASESVLKGYDGLGPGVSEYHSLKPAETRILKPGDMMAIDDLQLKATRTFHSDPTAIGLRITSKDGIISMTGDTALKEGIYKEHLDCDALVLSVTRPLQSRIPHHLSTEDAAALVELVKPKVAILTHFGMRFVGANPEIQANWVEKQTGVRTISAWDQMSLVMNGRAHSIQRCTSKKEADQTRISVDLDDSIA